MSTKPNSGMFKKGNKAGEIWTEEKTIETLNSMLETLKNDETIIDLIDLVVIKYDLYLEIITHWKKRHPENNTVIQTIKKIKNIIEHRIAKGAMNNEYNPTFSIFNLKHNYGWKDKQEIEQTNRNTNINIEVKDLKEKEKIDNILDNLIE